jgi:hypothetical protein
MQGEAKKAGVELDETYLNTRLSRAKERLDVHYEYLPHPKHGSRRDIYKETMEHPSTTRCHRSLWEWGNLKHTQKSRRRYWMLDEHRLNLSTESMAELNEIELKFWENRWAVGPVLFASSPMLTCRTLFCRRQSVTPRRPVDVDHHIFQLPP